MSEPRQSQFEKRSLADTPYVFVRDHRADMGVFHDRRDLVGRKPWGAKDETPYQAIQLDKRDSGGQLAIRRNQNGPVTQSAQPAFEARPIGQLQQIDAGIAVPKSPVEAKLRIDHIPQRQSHWMALS